MNSRFSPLLEQFCRLAELSARPVEDATGLFLGATLGGVDFELFQPQSQDGDRFFSRVVFGPLSPPDEPQQWRALLAANMGFPGAGGQAFSRDPVSGEAVLQQSWAGGTTPDLLYRQLSCQMAVARDWRSGALCGPDADDSLFQDEDAAPRGPAGHFQRVCDELREQAALQDFSPVSMVSSGAAFMVEVQGVEIWACHFHCRADLIHLYADLVPVVDGPAGLAGQLAEANAWLFADRMGSAFCLREATQDYVLRSVMPLSQATRGVDLWRGLVANAQAVLDVRRSLQSAATGARPGDAMADMV